MTLGKKALSLFVAFVMAVTLIPTVAFAEESETIAGDSWVELETENQAHQDLNALQEEAVLKTSPDGNFYYYDYQGFIEITAYKGTSKNVVIPRQIDGMDVASVDIYFTSIDSIDIREATALKRLAVVNCDLKSLVSSGSTSLTTLALNFNQLTSLDISNFPNLDVVSCGSNNIKSLDISKNAALRGFSAERNGLVSITIGTHPLLVGLSLSDNKLTAIDVSGLPALLRLTLEGNPITALDITKNLNLDELNVVNCNLTDIDISKNSLLGFINISQNMIQDIQKFIDWDNQPDHQLINDGFKAVPFADVPIGHWAIGYIAAANDLEFMTGIAGTENFAPDNSITRAEVVTALWKAAGQPAPKAPAAFNDLGQDWYLDSVAWASENGITTGVEDYPGAGTFNSFQPERPVTREEFVTFFSRYADYRGASVMATDTSAFDAMPDSGSVSTFAIAPMKWAMQEKIITGLNGRIAPAGGATRAEVATMMVRAYRFIG